MAAIGGKYEVGERLGGGGMAEVFRATIRGAEGFSRPVAIKRIKRSISTDKGFAELFVTEARLAAKLHHPNVIQTLDFDRDENGCFYLVMELIDGVDLRTLEKSGPVSVSASCFIVSELLRALDYAHELVEDGRPVTIIHRDISPHNIMLGWQGAVKVVDFGIAKAIEGSLISRSGSLKGKVSYMSPEQIHGQSLDGRSDLFAVGIVLYELLTGTRLFVARTEAETLSKVLTAPIASPRSINALVPSDLDAIVMRLLERDRNMRYRRARDAMEELVDSSTSVTQGRRDLEALLCERFPDRAPKRTARLTGTASSSESESKARTANRAAEPDLAHAVGEAATVRAERAALEEKDTVPHRPVPKPVPKRTLTAEPALDLGMANTAMASIASVPKDEAEPCSPRRWPTRVVGLALVAVCVLVASTMLGRESSETTAPEAQIAVAEEPAVAPAPKPTQSPEPRPTVAGSVDAGSGVGTNDAAVRREPDESEEPRERAVLTLRVKPWATITVDGKNYGQTPQTIRLRHGRHRVNLENSGLGKRESFSLSLRSGQKKTIEKDWR